MRMYECRPRGDGDKDGLCDEEALLELSYWVPVDDDGYGMCISYGVSVMGWSWSWANQVVMCFRHLPDDPWRFSRYQKRIDFAIDLILA